MKKITADTTFAELKAMVKDASQERTPVGKSLIKSEEPILIRVKEGIGTVTVYENGFFVYSEEGNHTARAVANCKVMKYPVVEGKPVEVKEEDFQGLPFPIVLSQFGMVNLEDQKKKNEGYHHGISLDDDELRMEESLCVPDFTEGLDREEDIWEKRKMLLPEIMEMLTERQKEIAFLFYGEKVTQEQIGKLMGISDRVIRYHLNAVEKKFKKVRKKYFR